jgi:menaquinone-dependent protoporphyrinogen oxidase
MKVLVAVASRHGSTEGIAQAIANRLRELGHEAEARAVQDIQDMGEVEALVLGSAVQGVSSSPGFGRLG